MAFFLEPSLPLSGPTPPITPPSHPLNVITIQKMKEKKLRQIKTTTAFVVCKKQKFLY